ncbi:MAG: hypothetical protein ABI231_08665 [Candidatus Tumulicola sp.]
MFSKSVIHLRLGIASIALSAAALAGCGMHSSNAPLFPSPAQYGSQAAFPNVTPPNCKGQQTLKDHASDQEKLLAKGGSLCIPAFGGLGGSVKYPPANPSVGITLISSTTNYNHKLPSLHSGNPIFYLQLATTGGTTFGPNVQAGGGLTGKPIKAGSTYTVYGQATIFGIPVNFTPCYTVATTGKYGGVIGGVGTLLKGQNIPAAASGVIEIYSGKSASGKC